MKRKARLFGTFISSDVKSISLRPWVAVYITHYILAQARNDVRVESQNSCGVYARINGRTRSLELQSIAEASRIKRAALLAEPSRKRTHEERISLNELRRVGRSKVQA